MSKIQKNLIYLKQKYWQNNQKTCKKTTWKVYKKILASYISSIKDLSGNLLFNSEILLLITLKLFINLVTFRKKLLITVWHLLNL